MVQSRINPIPQSAQKKPNSLNKLDIELLNDKTAPDELAFKLNGKKMILKEAELRQLLQPMEKNAVAGKNPYPTQPAPGIKSASSIIQFLKSPSNERFKNLIHDQLALVFSLMNLRSLKSMNEEQHTRQELQRQLFMAHFRLMKIAKRKAARKELNAAYQRQIDKSLAYGRALAEQSSNTADKIDPSAFADAAIRQRILDAYDLALKLNENEIMETLEEQKMLEETLLQLDNEHEKIHQRYAILEGYLLLLDNHFDALDLIPSHQERITATQAALARLQTNMQEINTQIQQHINNNEDHKASELLYHLDGLTTLEVGMYKTLSDINTQKIMYDADDKETKSFKNAVYTLHPEEKIHTDSTGKKFLLKPGQRFTNLSAEEKEEAHQRFENSPELKSTRMLAQQNKSTEVSFVEQNKNEITMRYQENQNRLLQLRNECASIKAAQGRVQAFMLQPQADFSQLPTPKPTPSSNSTSAEKKSEEKSKVLSTQFFRQQLEAISLRPTPQVIEHLKNNFILPNGKPNTVAQDLITNSIRPNEPLLPTKMNDLLRNLERLGVLANKPNVTSIPSRHPNKLEQEPNKAPNPFKITPSPF